MAYADQQMSGNRVIAIIIVALIHIGLGYALITGLALDVVKEVAERVTTVDVTEEPPPPPEEEPPPPEEVPDVPQTVPPPVAPPPPINVATRPPDIRTTTTIPPPAPVQVRIPPPAPVIAPVPRPAPPPAPPAVNRSRGVAPKGQAGWSRRIQENYPRKAERDGVEGTVGVRVTVGPDGRVSACSVTASSGSSDLDAGACDGMTRYARFDPALNADGEPIPGSYSTRIQYTLN